MQNEDVVRAEPTGSNNIWVTNNLIAYNSAPYIRDLTVHLDEYHSSEMKMLCRNKFCSTILFMR